MTPEEDLDRQLEALLIRCPACHYTPGICSIDIHQADVATEIAAAVRNLFGCSEGAERMVRKDVLEVLRRQVQR